MAVPQIDFRPFLEVSGILDTGLSGVALTSEGKLPDDKAYGVQASAGVSGFHSWRHTTLGLDYRAAYAHYSTKTFYDGTNQSLMLGITHRITRHATFSLRENAGLYNRNFAAPMLPQTVPFDPQTTYMPTNDFFDNRTMYLSTQADLTVQRSTRLSLDLGADGFLVRRRSTALYGVSGAGARGDVQYRLSRRSTIGANYTYMHYSFTGIFSSTDLHGAVGSYGLRLSRTLELSAYGGFYRAETKFVRENIPLPPAVAEILGTTLGRAVYHDVAYLQNWGARFSRTVHRGVFYASAGHGVTPGNGLFLTSTMTHVSGGYSYTGLRRWSFNASAGYNASDSIGNVRGTYGGYVGTLSASRQIARSIHMILSTDARQYSSRDFSNYNRLIYRVRIGLGYSPGDIPLRLW